MALQLLQEHLRAPLWMPFVEGGAQDGCSTPEAEHTPEGGCEPCASLNKMWAEETITHPTGKQCDVARGLSWHVLSPHSAWLRVPGVTRKMLAHRTEGNPGRATGRLHPHTESRSGKGPTALGPHAGARGPARWAADSEGNHRTGSKGSKMSLVGQARC